MSNGVNPGWLFSRFPLAYPWGVGKYFGDRFNSDILYIMETRYIRPMLGEHAPTKRINLAKRHGLHPRPLEAEGESADAREKVEDFHRSP